MSSATRFWVDVLADPHHGELEETHHGRIEGVSAFAAAAREIDHQSFFGQRLQHLPGSFRLGAGAAHDGSQRRQLERMAAAIRASSSV
jgi:hypothetical protein